MLFGWWEREALPRSALARCSARARTERLPQVYRATTRIFEEDALSHEIRCEVLKDRLEKKPLQRKEIEVITWEHAERKPARRLFPPLF